MKKEYLCILIIFSVLVSPILILADGGMIPWPREIYLDQSAQNAIVAWNGNEEIIILSVDIEGSDNATVLRIIPLPSNPSEIKEGSFESFEKLVEIMNEKMEVGDWKNLFNEARGAQTPSAGIEITFQEKIGAHDITVVKVNDLDYFLNWIGGFTESKGFEGSQISSGFGEGVKNYLKKDIKYFVFDVMETGEEKESVNSLIYRFESDFLYYPILISGISEIGESTARINLFLITKKGITLGDYYYSHWGIGGEFATELTKDELEEVSSEIASLFDEEVRVAKTNIYSRLKDLNKDLILSPSYLWDKNLTVGSRGEEVKVLQQTLINDGLWEAEVGVTGYFGPVTKNALVKFQEKYKQDILRPIDLETGTGYFGPKTREYFEKISLSVKREELMFGRSLFFGMSGDDVTALQEILIAEDVWEKPEVGATGYFGPITQAAVIRFQEKYASEILEPLGLVMGTGLVGPSTRAYLEKNK